MPSFLRDRKFWAGLVLSIAALMVIATYAKAETIAPRAAASTAPVTRAEAVRLAPIPSWTGCYAGGSLKHVTGSTDVGLGVDGYAMGGIGGCDLQLGMIVLGGFADYDWGHVSQFGGQSYKEWSFGGRAGVIVAPTVLVYALVSRPQIQYASATFNGIGVGGGVDVQLTKNWAIGMEYRHETFDTIFPGANAREDSVGARLTFRVDVPKLQQ